MQLRAELQRALQHGDVQHVALDGPELVLAVRHGRHYGLDVDQFRAWVGGALQEEHLGGRPNGVAPLREVATVHQRCRHAEAGQQILHDVATGAKQGARATTWSPAFTSPISAAVTAAMPLAGARAACVPSSSAMRRSNIATVGLEKRGRR